MLNKNCSFELFDSNICLFLHVRIQISKTIKNTLKRTKIYVLINDKNSNFFIFSIFTQFSSPCSKICIRQMFEECQVSGWNQYRLITKIRIVQNSFSIQPQFVKQTLAAEVDCTKPNHLFSPTSFKWAEEWLGVGKKKGNGNKKKINQLQQFGFELYIVVTIRQCGIQALHQLAGDFLLDVLEGKKGKKNIPSLRAEEKKNLGKNYDVVRRRERKAQTMPAELHNAHIQLLERVDFNFFSD